MARHFLGHTSTQALQVQQRSLSIVQSFSALVTTMASVGQRLAQAPQKMQESMSIAMLPRLRSILCASRTGRGYRLVAGREKRFRITVRVMPKTDISTSPCS